MNEGQKKHIKKTFGDEGLKEIENLVDSHGINRKIIETKNLKTNTELALATLKKLKRDFWYNIIYIFLGFALGFIPTKLTEDKNLNTIELMNKQLLEKNEQQTHFEIEFQKMRLELSSIKKEMELKKIKKSK